jgi:replicative DNA helicase
MKVGKRKKKDLKGIQHAVRYFTSEAVKFRQGAGTRTSGDIRSEEVVNEILSDYEARKRNPVASQSMYSFISRMDDTIRGVKPGQLMLVAGYSGMGKTTVAANLAYNGIYQGLNGLYITIEMTFKEITDVMTTLHSSAPKWYTHDKYSHLAGKINHEDVVFGELSELQEEFWKFQVKDWLDPNNGYGHLFLEQPTGTITPSEVTNLCYHYNSQLNEQGTQLDFLVLDYFGLMKEDAGQSARDWNTDLNSIIKKSKSLALTFNEGQMLRVISPFQINRAGYDAALKNDGVYPLSSLSNANEAERTSDIVISVFTTDEMKKAGIAKIACMKHRQGATFSPFEAHLDFKTKRLSDFIQVKDGDSDELIQDIPMDV